MSEKTGYLFVGGPMHGTTREIEEVRGFTAIQAGVPHVESSGFEEDGHTYTDQDGTYTKRGVYLDFDGGRHLRHFFVWDGEELSLRRVFDAILRLYFSAGRRVEHIDAFTHLRPVFTPFDGPPGSNRAN